MSLTEVSVHAPAVSKQMHNPELRDKFSVGMTISIPKSIFQRFTTKLAVIAAPHLAKVRSAGDRQVGHHFRFAIDVTSSLGRLEIWEEWMLERLSVATPNQINKFKGNLPNYLA